MDVRTESISELLSESGPLARQLDGFRERPQQQEMAELIAAAITQGSNVLCEAGTGTGKTLAYLVPALFLGRQTIVSTATKTLQDQLFFRDIPLVTAALGSAAEVRLLKGRANYLCLERLVRQSGAPDLFGQQHEEFSLIERWSHETESGDISTLAAVGDSAAIWPKVTSTVENCLGQNCDYFDQCFVVKARREASGADLVVVNHHLLFADVALKEEGFGELLPSAEVVVLDEAHQVPGIASNFFGNSVSSFQLRELARDALTAHHDEAADDLQLRTALECIEVVSADMQAVLTSAPSRADWYEIAGESSVKTRFEELIHVVDMVQQQLEHASARGPALDSCHKRIQRLRAAIRIFESDDAASAESEPAQGTDWIRWFERSNRGFVLHATPVSVAEQFKDVLERYRAAWIFTSATLAIAGDFSYFQRQLGLEQAEVAAWDSPFDYPNQGLMMLPRLGVDPRDRGYTECVVELALKIIDASRGRTFMLFTSYRALEQAAELMRDRIDYPLLVQGEAPRAQLLEDFQEYGDAVLLGTATFWQGVDVRGAALSVVLIDKLPFAPPNDPVTRARIRSVDAQGGSGFNDYQVPEAVITLKQGAGRLIRDETDRGVLVICDPRVETKSYGKKFLAALPPMRRTSDLGEVLRTLRAL